MLGVDRASEEFDTIVQVVVYLYVVNLGPGTHTLEGDAVKLVLGVYVGAGVLDYHVPEAPRVVPWLVATEQT